MDAGVGLAGLGAVGHEVGEDFLCFLLFGDGDVGGGNAEIEIDGAEANGFGGGDDFFFDAAAFDEAAIARTDVAKGHAKGRDVHLAVEAGNAGLLDLNVV